MTSSSPENLRIAFVHPDLGIGGAEQLIINFALALQNKGHFVKIYTPHHDKDHCFKETRDGTLNVEVRGNLFPREILGKLTAFCAIVRMILATLYIILYGGKYDVIVVDQVSASIPLFRLFRRKVVFYCHYPDKLLCVQRGSIVKKFYRFFLDYIEELTTGFSNLILVNSDFTRQTFKKNFRILNFLNHNPEILYPAVDFSKFDKITKASEFMKAIPTPYFLSLNRYERKKGIDLAIRAFAEVKRRLPNTNFRLVIAGGYDTRVRENVEHLEELRAISKAEGLQETKDIQFLCSVSDIERGNLLENCYGVLYTPENEHFGIVPTEAMYMEKPVIACNSGGPLETVSNESTGYLLPKDHKIWADAMEKMINNPTKVKEMGIIGKKNCKERFGLDAFGNQANESILSLIHKTKQN